MSLSRSPSPQRGGGWASPGLTAPYSGPPSRRTSPLPVHQNGASREVTWALAQARSAEVKGSPSFQPRNGGFLGRNIRKLSVNLPRFGMPHAENQEAMWGKPENRLDFVRSLLAFCGRLLWRFRVRFAYVGLILLLWTLFYLSPLYSIYQRSPIFGGGSKYVIILAANVGGGVMEWKGPREWAIERDSIKNKRQYAKAWGYELEIVDMSTKKRYAHEWRESWEKVDTIRNTMQKYPQAEWFWWLDLNTFIMEPSYSLQHHIFNNLEETTYRDINIYNPLNISHPLTDPYLDPETRSVDGDGTPQSINLVLSQDCGGFNLGSFFVRRSFWSERLLDVWWDPVGYEQKHMEWEHKEQDALEALYRDQPWVRPHVAFLPQRRVNSFPSGACGNSGKDPRIHYNVDDRDFLVNMAGCEWGRDCWGEMYSFRELSYALNKGYWESFVDWLRDIFRGSRRQKSKDKIDIDKKLASKKREDEKQNSRNGPEKQSPKQEHN